MSRAPRPDGRIVEAANYPSRFEAELAISFLESAGIDAMGRFGDASGALPHYAMVDGFRVCVFDDDLDAAREILSASEI
jgi:Putative prokaryotic signal transducing protein